MSIRKYIVKQSSCGNYVTVNLLPVDRYSAVLILAC